MPGKQVKNWRQYEALRRRGMPKSAAARVANAGARKRRRRARARGGRH